MACAAIMRPMPPCPRFCIIRAADRAADAEFAHTAAGSAVMMEAMRILKATGLKTRRNFNVDNGTGAIRGIYLQGNEAVAPVFQAWMQPFKNLGMTTLAIRNTGGTDHLSFDAVGLPGFQFIQDPVEYNSRTHHSNMDVYERIQAPDMMKNAVIVASFVYLAANRDEKLPRKPLPPPQPR